MPSSLCKIEHVAVVTMTGWTLKQSTFRDRRPPPAATGLVALVRRLVMRLRWRWAAL
jgi:hypothetical protein